MKCIISLILLSVIQLIIQTQAAGCGNIPNCQSYKPDPCNTCSCTDPINSPTLAMCTRAYCPDPTFIPECIRCIDGYTLLNKRCTSLSISPVEPIQIPRPIQIEPIPPALHPIHAIYFPHAVENKPPIIKTLPPKPFPTKPISPLPIKPLPIKTFPIKPLPIQLPIEIEPVPPLPIKPCMCAQIYAPVCCSDGQTYSNQCSASCNGLTSCKTGECSSITDPILPCKYVPICNYDPCAPYYNYPVSRLLGNVQCEGYPNAHCETKIDCNGCTAIFRDEYANEINCIQPYQYQGYTYGRPYNINKNLCDLKANIKEINCNEYEFYFHDIEYSNGRNVSVNNDIISDWVDRGLSEHAAVGTFAKFKLDLMSIGAPLWFLEMANNASFDEMRHTKITFDIVNMYIKHGNSNNNNNNGNCIFYNDFPMHNIQIDGNYNRISLDAANGGCFGETLSVFVTYLNGYNSNNNKIQNYLYIVSIDEIRHASLSWVTVKWIMDKKGKDVQVYDINWWKTQLEYLLKNSIDNNNKNIEQYVYKYVIPSVFEVLWLDNGDLIQIKDYNKLYHSINSLLKDHLDIVIEKIIQ